MCLEGGFEGDGREREREREREAVRERERERECKAIPSQSMSCLTNKRDKSTILKSKNLF